MDTACIRKMLTNDKTIEMFDNFIAGKALGASSNIKSIIEFARDIVCYDSSFEDVKTTLEYMFTFFDELRGNSSIAVRNAINALRINIAFYQTSGEMRDDILSKCNKVSIKIKEDNQQIVDGAVKHLGHLDRLFVFDYSSTVDMIVDALFHINPGMVLSVAESRILNGGVPFVVSAIKRGERVNFITDATMAREIEASDAVLIGAETIYKEGSVINTPGSELAALCAKRYSTPYYVATSYLKYDARGERMFAEKDSMDSFERILAPFLPNDGFSNVSFMSHGYALVDADLITGYFTEKGYVPSSGFLNSDGEWSV